MFHRFLFRRQTPCAAAFAVCLLLGAPACVDKTNTVPPAPAGSAAETLTPAAQSSASPGLRRAALPLPSVTKAEREEALHKALRDFTAAISQDGSGISPDNGLKSIEDALTAAAGILQDKETAKGLYMYKYVLRYLTERALFLDPQADKNKRAAAFFTKGQGRWQAFAPEWEFEPSAEAYYAILYGGGKVNPRGPEGQEETIPNPLWSTKVFLAVRGGDLQQMRSLHEAAGFADYPRWPLETFLRLFTCSSVQSVREQWEKLAEVIRDKPIKGASWSEIGFGDGRLFSVLRRELGSGAKIYGAADDENCLMLATLAERSGKTDWGSVELLPVSAGGCGLPAAGMDFIHVNGLCLAGISPDDYAQALQPFWLSLQKALKPGGLLIIDTDSAALPKLRGALEALGFKESCVCEDRDGSARGLPSVYAAFTCAG